MSNNKQLPRPRLGPLETQFFAYVQMRRKGTVRSGEISSALGITAAQETDLFRRLRRAGFIVRVRRGLYLVPPRLPLGGKWSPGEAIAITALFNDNGGRYQLCGPNAFSRYGFDDQVPNRLYAYNNRLSGDRRIGTVNITLIKVATVRLGATERDKGADGTPLVYSSRARTLMDAVYDWDRFNGIPRAYGWIQSELRRKPDIAAELVKVTLKYGNQGTIRRIGYLLEKEKGTTSLLRELETRLRESDSLIPWIPNQPKRGKVVLRWGVIDNAQAR